jgi:uncharacterized protein (DUF983 family)
MRCPHCSSDNIQRIRTHEYSRGLIVLKGGKACLDCGRQFGHSSRTADGTLQLALGLAGVVSLSVRVIRDLSIVNLILVGIGGIVGAVLTVQGLRNLVRARR